MREITRLINALPRLQARIEDPTKYLAIQARLRLLRALEDGAFNIQKASHAEWMFLRRWFGGLTKK